MVFVRSKTDRRFACFCRTGDPDALADVFDATAARLLRVALWLCRHRADAEDLVQRTFLQAIALREQFEPGRRVLPWLLGLLSNQAHRLRREQQRLAATAAVPVVERVVDPEVEVVARELQDAVRAVRANLSEPYRDVLELHLEQGLDAGEIAQRLGRPAGTVRTQLVRALEMLRKKLPSGFVAGFAPVAVPGEAGLLAVKAVVMSAARRSTPPVAASAGAAVAVIGGVLVAKKLLLVVPVLAMVAGFAAYQAWPGSAPEPASSPSLLPTAVAAEVDAEPVAPVDRVEVDPPSPGAAEHERFDPSPPQVTPWLARLFVVDADELPVADAVITIWPARRYRLNEIGGSRVLPDHNRYQGHFPQVLAELHTDATGRAERNVDIECVAAMAEKAGVGFTGCLMLRNTSAAAKETRFVLEAPVILHGRVLRSDGLPAPGARVSAGSSGTSIYQQGAPAPLAPAVAGGDGRFELAVQHGCLFSLSAELEGARMPPVRVWGFADQPEVVLVFPGGISISGIVFDGAGKAVAKADVSVWREFDPHGDGADWERANGSSDDHGRFSVLVGRHARYQLIASANGYASSKVEWVETTAVRPHAEARLVLQEFTTIAGRVVHEDGSTFLGATVAAEAESGCSRGYSTVPNRIDQFQEVKAVAVGDEGGFTLAVHPGTTWTIVARPRTGGLSVRQAGVAPGSAGVVMCLSDEALAGCVVHGSVARGDGLPVGPYSVGIYFEENGITGLADAGAITDGDHFTLPPLPLGRQYSLRVAPIDKDRPEVRGVEVRGVGAVAPARIGPFTTDKSELTFEFRLERWGEVPVRVLAADGTPAHRVRVCAARDVDIGFSASERPGDAGGRVLLQRCAPGAHHLRVGRDSTTVLQQELLITPGLNPEVVLRLPAAR